ncbi:putative lysophospholipase L1 biosynthesis ABC-type transport system permease subunit [Anaerotaenia torta]|uniref:ABC transporter permease n=1 Tax=Anaerotaenia torta TaxID=433293 RepID=UPI003D1AC708
MDGDNMVVGIKDAAKLMGISIIACCAVLVCTLFLNFNMDIIGIQEEITSEQMMIFYDAQVSTAKVVSMVSGGCLLITSVIMLLFYIKHYIDTHKKELGILKALGYSNLKIAKNFWVFGITIFIGTMLGFCGAFLLMPSLYKMQNKDKILPDVSVHFHPTLLLYLVIVPAVAFSILSVCYACYKLRMPVLALLKENVQASFKGKKHKTAKNNDGSFIDDLKKNILKSKKTLVFFIIFASFCFSAMTQMSFSMNELASVMMGAMIMLIGIVLACTTLFLAITTVINNNTKTIAMMRVFGYSQKECCRALLGGYRPMAYIGFAIGTVYQYALLRIMVNIVFKDVEGVPVYEFNFPVMLISLVTFIVIYEIVMYTYSEKIKKISIKEIMFE